MTQFLPPNLLALFAPREPIPYLPPVNKLPHEKKSAGYVGVGAFLQNFEDPKDTPPPVRGETREERLERRKRERNEQVAYKLEQEIAVWDPASIPNVTADPFKTLFIARINYDTSESKLRREFEVYGPVRKIVVVHNTINGKPRGYAFIEYEHERDMHSAYKHADGKKIDGRRVLVDVERARTVKGWLPRRLGGGLGGTRRGGPDVNIKHSGREDNERERERYRLEREREAVRGVDRESSVVNKLSTQEQLEQIKQRKRERNKRYRDRLKLKKQQQTTISPAAIATEDQEKIKQRDRERSKTYRDRRRLDKHNLPSFLLLDYSSTVPQVIQLIEVELHQIHALDSGEVNAVAASQRAQEVTNITYEEIEVEADSASHRRSKLTNAEKCKKYREKVRVRPDLYPKDHSTKRTKAYRNRQNLQKLQNENYDEILQLPSSPQKNATSSSVSLPSNRLSNTERSRNYRRRLKLGIKLTKQPPLSEAQRKRNSRARKNVTNSTNNQQSPDVVLKDNETCSTVPQFYFCEVKPDPLQILPASSPTRSTNEVAHLQLAEHIDHYLSDCADSTQQQSPDGTQQRNVVITTAISMDRDRVDRERRRSRERKRRSRSRSRDRKRRRSRERVPEPEIEEIERPRDRRDRERDRKRRRSRSNEKERLPDRERRREKRERDRDRDRRDRKERPDRAERTDEDVKDIRIKEEPLDDYPDYNMYFAQVKYEEDPDQPEEKYKIPEPRPDQPSYNNYDSVRDY